MRCNQWCWSKIRVLRCRHGSKKFFKERITVRFSIQEVLCILYVNRTIISQGQSSLTFRESSSSRLPPGHKILSRYSLPLAGLRGSVLNTVAAEVRVCVKKRIELKEIGTHHTYPPQRRGSRYIFTRRQ